MKKAAISVFLILATPLAAQPRAAPFGVSETGRSYGSLQDAVDAIGNGQGTILIAPGVYSMCAVQEEGRVTYVAREPGTVILDGAICEGKAALVLKGRAAHVEGLVFRNLRVADGNGAGIRLQQGDLLVRESLFMDSESGILSHDDPASSIRIEQTTFSGLGRCDRGLSCAHSIYIGDYGALSIVRARFERGTGGHYVKTRAARIDIADSSFDDSGGRATNYMVDLSNGATGRIVRNAFVQGPDKENYSALIMVAAEGKAHRSAGLLVSDNEAGVAPGFTRRTSFVADRSGEPLRIENNRLAPQIARFEQR